MDIIFGLIGLIIMLAIGVGVILVVVFLARKMGVLSQFKSKDDDALANNGFNLGGWLKQSIVWRFALVAVLIALMTIPMAMVTDVIRERSELYYAVQSDVAATWGKRQQVKGPSLLIPYTERFDSVEVLTDKDGNERKKNKTVYRKRTAILLPEDLNLDVKLLSDTRTRGIYDALVYTADIKISGAFKRPSLSGLSNNIDEIHWNRAWFSVGLSDTQAINKVSELRWNNTLAEFEPGTKITNIVNSGFHAPLDLREPNTNVYEFELDINVNGSQGFYFTPFGKITNIQIDSDWPHPSFQGNVLPDSHNINADGFNAKWSVPHLARNYPQLWTLEVHEFDINEFSAGVNLFESVSLYSQITRAIKYGVLFLVLTYLTFLLFEMGIGQRLHIVQYGVIGLALSIFYLTLLSMAEHAGFLRAYVSAAAIIIIMIGVYVLAALRSLKRAGIITILLISLYGLLYTMLQLEDYALLAGTSLLLVVLAAMMYLTRNVGKPQQNLEA